MVGVILKLWLYRIFLIICLTSVVAFIVYNSTRTKEQSTKISSDVTVSVAETIVENYDKLTEKGKLHAYEALHVHVREIAHVLEYGALCGFLALLLFTVKFNYGRFAISSVLTVLICFLVAMVDEWLQGSLFGRAMEWKDVGMDMLGCIVGVVLAIIADFILLNRLFVRDKRWE